jgi:hypothetical protein
MHGKAIVHGRAAQAVAVGDFNQRHAGFIECGSNRAHLFQRHLMALGVHAITQGHVMDSDFFTF